VDVDANHVLLVFALLVIVLILIFWRAR